MGNKQNKNKKFIPNALFLENINKRKLFTYLDFSIESMQNEAKMLYEESQNIDNENEKYFKLKEAISYNNTNEKILKELLTIEKNINFEEYNKNISLYYYHISPETYQSITGKNKNDSSVELLKEIFNKLKGFQIKDKNYNEQCLEKDEIYKYFYSNIKIKPTLKANSIFTLKSNLELTLNELLNSLFISFNKKIDSLLIIINDKNYTLEQKLKSICLIRDYEIINLLLKDVKVDENIVLLYNSNFFTNILGCVGDYLLKLDETINQCLKFENIETDFYILLFIILEIKLVISNESKPVYTNKIKNYLDKYKNKNDLDSNNKSINYNNSLNIKDIYKYDRNEIKNEIENGAKFEEFDEIRLYKFVKLEYYNSNNIIRHMMPFIEKFNEKISKSKTIQTALYEIYPELKGYKLFESEFTPKLFKKALENSYFFPFHVESSSVTFDDSTMIIFFIPNKTKIEENKLGMDLNRTLYLIGNLSVFLYVELQEVLGHYLKIILSKILNYDYESLREHNSSDNEAGMCIELLLFGERISTFSVKQLLYLLDVNNYNKELKKFTEDFKDIDSKFFAPSDELKYMLKEIDIDLDIYSVNTEKEYGNLFREKYILEDNIIEIPIIKGCVERYERIKK